jgi:hypothetical protein
VLWRWHLIARIEGVDPGQQVALVGMMGDNGRLCEGAVAIIESQVRLTTGFVGTVATVAMPCQNGFNVPIEVHGGRFVGSGLRQTNHGPNDEGETDRNETRKRGANRSDLSVVVNKSRHSESTFESCGGEHSLRRGERSPSFDQGMNQALAKRQLLSYYHLPQTKFGKSPKSRRNYLGESEIGFQTDCWPDFRS